MHLMPGGQLPRGRLIDLNLVPSAYRPRALPLTGAGFGLLAAVGVFLFLALFQFKATADTEITQLQADLQQQQARLANLGTASTGPESVLDKNRIGWSRVLQTIIASQPGDVRLQDVSFMADGGQGPRAIVRGEAAEYPAIVEFADNLRSSPFFARVSIQSMGQAPAPAPVTTATATATATPRSGSVFPAGQATALPPVRPTYAVPPGPPAASGPSAPLTLNPSATNTRAIPTAQLLRPSATPTPANLFGPPLVITPTITGPGGPAGPTTAAATRTPVGLPGMPGLPGSNGTATPTATPNAGSFDFAVESKTQTCDDSLPADSLGYFVSGQVVDTDGSPLAGIGVRVTSIHTITPWSADTSTDSDGQFRFWLSKANFSARVTTGSSQVASELWTRSTSEAGACSYEVVFKKVNPGTPVAQPTTTGTVTATPTTPGTATPTPASGTPLAGTPSASNNSANAGLALDGNTGTEWNGGASAPQHWQETFDTTYYIAGINLTVSQLPNGNTTHIVHFYDASGAELNGTSVTFSGYTFDGQVLTRSFSPNIAGVKSVKVETTAGPSWVAWREVQVMAGAGLPTPTPTALKEPDDTWQQAKPIGVGQTQARTFYRADDTDWAVFYTDNFTGTTYIRAVGDSGIHPEATLHELTGDTIAYRAQLWKDELCNPGVTTASSISRTLSSNTAYYLGFTNALSNSGTYTITVQTSAISCPAMVLQGAGAPTSSPSPTVTTTNATPTPTLTPPVAEGERVSGLAARLLSENAGNPLAPSGPVVFTLVLDLRTEGAQ